MRAKLIAGLVAVFTYHVFSLGQSHAADLKIVPGGVVILNPTNANKNYYDSVIHAIVIAAEAGESFTLQSLNISFMQNGTTLLVKTISAERVVGESQGMAKMVDRGLSALVGAQILNEGGLDDLLGYPVSLTTTANLTAQQALVTGRHHFSLDFIADKVLVTATLVTPDGATSTISRSVPVQIYSSPIAYSNPVEGVWLKTADASIQGHHRLNPGTEFAVDFFKLNEAGEIYNGDNYLAENYFGFGEQVMAAADGEVVFIISDDIQNRAIMRRQESELPKDARRRISKLALQKMVTDLPRALAGNIVVLRHDKNGHIEYSSYGHLASDSVVVTLGQKVRRGDILGRVGDTGDSLTVHLHFQVNSQANPFFSKSLPIVFDNLEVVNKGVDPLRFVRSRRLQ